MASINNWEWLPDDDTSDELREFCEKCYASFGSYEPPYAFNKQSKEYLCQACFNYKPVKIQTLCNYHVGKKRDEFCYTHFSLICALCHIEHHTPPCQVKPIADLSWDTDSELNALEDGIKSFRNETFEAMARKAKAIQLQRKYIIDAVTNSFDDMLSKIKYCKERVIQDANDKCNEMMKTSANHLNKTGEYMNEFESMLPEIDERDSHVHAIKRSKATELIIKIGEYSNTLFESMRKDTISRSVVMFENLVCQSLCQMQHPLNDDWHHHKNETVITVENTKKVRAITNQTIVKVVEQKSARIDNLHAHRLESIKVKVDEDVDDCCITGLCVTDEGQILMADCYNKKVKYFSSEGNLLSSLLMSGEPFDISISGKSEAVTTMWENQKKIHIISFADEHLGMKSTISLRNRVIGIAAVENGFAVSCDDTNPGVMLIDRAGKTKWHQYFKEGKRLFKSPGYIITVFIKEVPHIIVSDKDLHTLTVIEAKTGEVIKVCCLSKTGPYGLTSWHGNVIVSYCYSAGVCIWTPDLSTHLVLLSTRNSLKRPHAVVFNPLTNDLLLSSWRCNTMERFKISSAVGK